MRNKYLEVSRLLRNFFIQVDDKELKEYIGRTAISRAYEAVFLELFFYFTEDLGVSYAKMKRKAKEYYKEKNVKVPLNKHTTIGAYLTVKYGVAFGKMYEKLRKTRNDVDYYINLDYVIDEKLVDENIKSADIILNSVMR